MGTLYHRSVYFLDDKDWKFTPCRAMIPSGSSPGNLTKLRPGRHRMSFPSETVFETNR